MSCIQPVHAIVGEAPLWSPQENRLYWVDIVGQKLFIYDPQTNQNQSIDMPDMITTIALRKEGELLIALRKQVVTYEMASKKITVLHEVEKDLPDHRFNDGKCDSAGRFWVGTINMVEPTDPSCRLYCVEGDRITVQQEGIVFSNGLCWSLDNRRFYHVETFRRTVFVYDFDVEKGAISNKRPFIEFGEDEGIPDGLNVDREGGIWCAHFGGACVVRYNEQAIETDRITLPVPYITNCTFGGPDLSTLYITTGCEKVPEEERNLHPEDGGLFAQKLKVQGVVTNAFGQAKVKPL